MIHFDFTVTDLEAETIMDILHSELTRNAERMQAAIARADYDSIRFLQRDVGFLKSIFAKIHHTRTTNE